MKNGQESAAKIRNFYYTHKRMPSYREVADLMGYRSKNAAYELVEKLLEAGFVRRDNTGRLLPTSLFDEVRLLGAVEAGFPAVAEEQMLDTLSIDEFLVENRDATYLLTVKGDSMKDAGIVEGDLVLAERTSGAKPGQIVVAELDGEWTMKYLRKGARGEYLEAANDAYPDMYPKEILNIVAVVRGVVRKYRG